MQKNSQKQPSFWEDDDDTDEDVSANNSEGEGHAQSQSVRFKERNTRSAELKMLTVFFIMLLYCLYDTLAYKKPGTPWKSHEAPKQEDGKEWMSSSNNLDSYKPVVYTEFVEKWYGTSIIISSSVEEGLVDENIAKPFDDFADPFSETVPDLTAVNPASLPPANPQNEKKLSDEVFELINGRKTAREFHHIQDYQPFAQLPFCLLVTHLPSAEDETKVASSISKLDYQNYKVIFAAASDRNKLQKLFRNAQYVEKDPNSFVELEALAKERCHEESIIFPVSSALNPDSLALLNEVYQTHHAYLTFGSSDGEAYISSFYFRILSLIGLTDFDKTNRDYLKNPDFPFLLLPFLELTKHHSYEVSKNMLYQSDTGAFLISASLTSKAGYSRTPYQQLLKLSQSTRVSVLHEEEFLDKFIEREDDPAVKEQYLNKGKLFRALEYEELSYLPLNHSLNFREKAEIQKLFKVSEVTAELPICLTVISKNNVPGRRFEKAILSIIKQEYDNYHIVFIDDASSDDTLKQTAKFLRAKGLMESKVHFLANTEPKYPSYNILHAAYSFCKPDSIQVILEGSDVLVGRQVFKTLNAIYQKNHGIWLVYSASANTHYEYGQSKPVVYDSRLVNKDLERMPDTFLDSLVSWRIPFLTKIPIENFQYGTGKWLNTSFVVSMQHPLLEAATTKHIKYIPSIFYFKTEYAMRGYADSQKQVDEEAEKKIVLEGAPSSPLASITDTQKSAEKMEAGKKLFLNDDRSFKYYSLEELQE